MVRDARERHACRRNSRAAFTAAFARKTCFVTGRTEIGLLERVELRGDRLVAVDARETVGLEREEQQCKTEGEDASRLLTWYCLPSNSVMPKQIEMDY